MFCLVWGGLGEGGLPAQIIVKMFKNLANKFFSFCFLGVCESRDEIRQLLVVKKLEELYKNITIIL